MHPNLWLQLAGWAAYLSAAATIVTMVTIALWGETWPPASPGWAWPRARAMCWA